MKLLKRRPLVKQLLAKRGNMLVVAGLGAPAFVHSLTQDIFNLPVDAAQIVRRPLFQLLPKLRVNAEQEGFA